MDYVIDFTGFYFFNQFIIEEFCECRVSQKGVKVGDAMIFAIDPTDVSSYGITQSGMEDYYNTFGIGISHSRHLLSDLVKYIKQLLSTNKTIYLRDTDKLQQLKEFMKIPHNYDNVACLDDKGFNVFDVVWGTDCRYHDHPNKNYCARDNANLMANWLKDKKFPKCVAVIDLSGYRTINGDFKVKELCISLLNKFGQMIDKASLVTVVPQAQDTSEEVVEAYNETYYDNYGIKWKTGNLPLPILGGTVKKLLSNYDVTDIFVRNREIEMKLSSIVQDIVKFEILRLTDFGYTDAINTIRPTICNVHEHLNPRKNVCAVITNFRMVQFIIDMQLFKITVLEDIKNFKQMSQQLLDVGNSSINQSNLSNLSSNQTYADSDVDSAVPESGPDDSDDLRREFQLDINTETFIDVDIDILLESQDVRNDDFSVINFDIDLL